LGTSSPPAPPERRVKAARIPEARALEAPLRALARARRAAPLLYLELTGLETFDGDEGKNARAACMRAAAAALRDSVGLTLRQKDPVVAGPGARWFAALLVDRAVAGSSRAAVMDADIGVVADRLRTAVQGALDRLCAERVISARVGVRAGWTVIEPRDGERPLTELRHALRGAAVVARVEERRAVVLAAITHELRTPLTSIIGFAERLDNGAWEAGTKRRRALAIISDEARRLSRLVEGLIDLGAWNAGRLALHKKAVRLRALGQRAAAAVEDVARVRGVTLATCGDAVAEVDPDRILQVLVNLLDNAVRHAKPNGSVRLSISKRGCTCFVSVIDDGPGILPATARTLGSPFAVGPGGRVGLGLAISKMLVEAHGGTLVARGSRVTVSLPG
jgi:signal transduction histidine kinase